MLKFPIVGDSTPGQGRLVDATIEDGTKSHTTAYFKEIIVPYPHYLLSPAMDKVSAMKRLVGQAADLFTMMAFSSIIQSEPIIIGPAMANMVAFG